MVVLHIMCVESKFLSPRMYIFSMIGNTMLFPEVKMPRSVKIFSTWNQLLISTNIWKRTKISFNVTTVQYNIFQPYDVECSKAKNVRLATKPATGSNMNPTTR